MAAFMEAQALRLRMRLESDEALSDEEISEIDAILAELEPPRKPSKPTAALTHEAIIAEYGRRYDAGEEIFNPKDAFRQQKHLSTGDDDRLAIHEFVITRPDGSLGVEERVVIEQFDCDTLTQLGNGETISRGKKKSIAPRGVSLERRVTAD